MRNTDDLREVIVAEFARLDPVDSELAGRLEAQAMAAAGGPDPETAAAVALAVVEGVHAIVETPVVAAGPTVGELSARRLLAEALRPRRTPRAGS